MESYELIHQIDPTEIGIIAMHLISSFAVTVLSFPLKRVAVTIS